MHIRRTSGKDSHFLGYNLIKYIIFFLGKHYLGQIECIIAVLGTPETADLIYKVEEKTL
jgi:hypothetical protein